MKYLSYVSLFLVVVFASCKKDKFGDLAGATVTINVSYPAAYSKQAASGATITLTSTSDASVQTGTANDNGQVVFNDVLPGTYHINVNKSLSASDAAVLTGISTALSLNATQNNVVISNGQNPVYALQLQGSVAGSLLIKEVYYTGSRTASGGTYFSDQFVEIYNNSTDTLYLDSLCIGDVYGVSGLVNPTDVPSRFNTDKDNVYLNNVWRIPGTGKQHPLAPGKSIVIAQDGVNHKEAALNPNSPVDLSNADWETYNERADNRDADAPNVPNLERVYFTGGFDWLITVFGPGLVIFKADFAQLEQVAIPGSTLASRIKVPNTAVVDAFEALMDGNSGTFKRVPTALDAGFVFADNTYNMQSFRRKVSTTINGRRILQDSNNSGNDFEKLSKPTPRSFN